MNGVNPHAYLKATLEAFAGGHPASYIDQLLPWAFTPNSSRYPVGVTVSLTSAIRLCILYMERLSLTFPTPTALVYRLAPIFLSGTKWVRNLGGFSMIFKALVLPGKRH